MNAKPRNDDDRIQAFVDEEQPWHDELAAIRTILLECGLEECFKWRSPCYTIDDGNVAIVWGFKDYAGLGFFKGVLLRDHAGRLEAPGDNSRSVRLFKFTSVEQITASAGLIRDYVIEAIGLERAGARVDLPKDDIVYPEELITALEQDPELQMAFEALTPGRRRGYALFFADAKQAATRQARIENAARKFWRAGACRTVDP